MAHTSLDPRKSTMAPDEEEKLEAAFQEYLKNKDSNKQHPMYAVSSAAIGTTPTGYSTDPVVVRSRNQHFTKTFHGSGNFRNNGMSTGIAKSRVSSKFDGII